MSSSVPPRDGDSPTPSAQGLALADEDALRRTFFAEYAALTDEARADLGDEAAVLGPKVVEGAFVRAWDARDQFRSPAQLHEFLVQDVHHAAARALSRRVSARRYSPGGAARHDEAHIVAHAIAAADAEQSWTHVMHALHGEAHSPQALAEAAATSRHEAAEHIAIVTRETSLRMPIAIGVAAIALIAGGWFYIDRAGADARVAQALNGGDVHIHSSLPSQIGVVSLDDGSAVRLAPESKLTLPSAYGPKMRAMKLEGTAAFTVVPGKAPFQVHARDVVVVATGTAFTVRAYPADPAVTVIVDEGTVEVRRGETRTSVAKGSSLVVGAGVSSHPATASERDAADGWRQGFYSVDGKPLRAVLPELLRWYGLNITVPDATLLDRPVMMRASLDSTRQAIRGVEKSTGLQFGYVGQNMVFQAAAPSRKQHR